MDVTESTRNWFCLVRTDLDTTLSPNDLPTLLSWLSHFPKAKVCFVQASGGTQHVRGRWVSLADHVALITDPDRQCSGCGARPVAYWVAPCGHATPRCYVCTGLRQREACSECDEQDDLGVLEAQSSRFLGCETHCEH
jgi:hypothetical protein